VRDHELLAPVARRQQHEEMAYFLAVFPGLRSSSCTSSARSSRPSSRPSRDVRFGPQQSNQQRHACMVAHRALHLRGVGDPTDGRRGPRPPAAC
jgi:hypothetical protein